VDFHRRGRISDEYLEAIFELWHTDESKYSGEFVSFDDVAFGPKPIQRPHLPVWFGGDSDAALRRTARFGDGWAPWQTAPSDLPARMDFLRSQPGFDDRPFSLFFSLAAMHIGEGHLVHDTKPVGRRNAQKVVDQCGELASLGVTDT
jgi:hypothetical protein